MKLERQKKLEHRREQEYLNELKSIQIKQQEQLRRTKG